MTPIEFEGVNAMLGAPKYWDASTQGECMILPCMITEDPRNPGRKYSVSCWKPNEEDLKALNEGKGIFI